jgi:uncharacterized protein (TIGR03084 family)
VATLSEVLADMADESADLDRLVADLPPARWTTLTPAPGWTIAHQIAHLAWTDRTATLAVTDPAAFAAELANAMVAPESFVDQGAVSTLAEPEVLLPRWRQGRAELAAALRAVPAGQKIGWYGTSMSPISMATARIMETWAHGLDVADALGVTRTPTARLRHVAHLGHRTIGWSFLAHDRPPPPAPVALVLTAPDGSLWTFGPEDAADRVTGPALDFCLLVTQRRHRADLALTATPGTADEWLDIAQAFAGPPGAGRPPATDSGPDGPPATDSGPGSGAPAIGTDPSPPAGAGARPATGAGSSAPPATTTSPGRP